MCSDSLEVPGLVHHSTGIATCKLSLREGGLRPASLPKSDVVSVLSVENQESNSQNQVQHLFICYQKETNRNSQTKWYLFMSVLEIKQLRSSEHLFIRSIEIAQKKQQGSTPLIICFCRTQHTHAPGNFCKQGTAPTSTGGQYHLTATTTKQQQHQLTAAITTIIQRLNRPMERKYITLKSVN